MTDIESLQEAKRRWGECAYVRLDKRDEHVHKVGVREGELFWVMGAGKSWTEAFAQADGPGPKKVSA